MMSVLSYTRLSRRVLYIILYVVETTTAHVVQGYFSNREVVWNTTRVNSDSLLHSRLSQF